VIEGLCSFARSALAGSDRTSFVHSLCSQPSGRGLGRPFARLLAGHWPSQSDSGEPLAELLKPIRPWLAEALAWAMARPWRLQNRKPGNSGRWARKPRWSWWGVEGRRGGWLESLGNEKHGDFAVNYRLFIIVKTLRLVCVVFSRYRIIFNNICHTPPICLNESRCFPQSILSVWVINPDTCVSIGTGGGNLFYFMNTNMYHKQSHEITFF
jgi:hypothetical protein